jgi:hypothetical protein
MWPFKKRLDPERQADRQMYLESLRLLTRMMERQTELFVGAMQPDDHGMSIDPVKWRGES